MIKINNQIENKEGGSTGKLANTFVETGPTDVLVRQDIYTEKLSDKPEGTTPKEKPSALVEDKKKKSDEEEKPDNGFTIAGFPVSQVLEGATAIGADLYLNQDNYSKRVKDATPGDVYRDLDQDTKTDLASMMAASAGSTASRDDIKLLIGGTESSISPENFKSAGGFATMLSGLSGGLTQVEYKDIGAKAALVASIVDKAIALGIPNVIDKIITQIGDKKRERELMVSRLRQWAMISDIKTLNKVVDIIGVHAALEREPRLLEILVGGYTYSQNYDEVVNYQEKYTELVTFLDRMNPNWEKGQRNGLVVSSIKLYVIASDEARTLFRLNQRHYPDILAAEGFQEDSILNVISSHHQKITLLNK